MSLIQAARAAIRWNAAKRRWTVTVAMGEEVITRSPVRRLAREASDEALRSCAVEIARDEGYSLSPDEVSIDRG